MRPDVDGVTHYLCGPLVASCRLLRHLLSQLMLKRASDLRSRTNPIAEDCLLEIFEILEHIFIVLNIINKLR